MSVGAQNLRERRLEVVREHMESENHHDFDTALGTFDHPRYELVATGEVYDGPEEVAGYYRSTLPPSPTSATRTRCCTVPRTP